MTVLGPSLFDNPLSDCTHLDCVFEEVTILQPDQHLSEVEGGVVMLTECGLFHILSLLVHNVLCFDFAKTIASILSFGLD